MFVFFFFGGGGWASAYTPWKISMESKKGGLEDDVPLNFGVIFRFHIDFLLEYLHILFF